MIPPPDRHAERREHSIERLQQAAVELLATHSYADIRIEDITGAAGMAKGSLYMYFKGKDDLYVRAFNRSFEDIFTNEFSAAAELEDPGEALRAMVSFAVVQPTPSDEMMFVYRAVMDPALIKLVRPDIDKFVEQYLGAYEQLFSKLGRKDVEQVSYLLAVLLDGLWFYRIMEMEPSELSKSHKQREALRDTIISLFDL